MAEITQSRPNRRGGISAAVLRAMSLFGGLQVVQILCSIIRVKLVAVWIGPAGVGLFGIYNSAVEMISTISQLGMRNSAVRDVVGAPAARIGAIVAVVRRWAWFLGALGAVLTLAAAPLLSRLTFGDSDHSAGFVLLSVVMFLTSVLGAEQAIMQGTKNLKRLAVSSLWGAVGGLLISIPMYYWWRIDSIVPSIIAYAVVGCAAGIIYRVPPQDKPKLTAAETLSMGKGFISLGFYMTLSLFIGLLSSYLFMSYLNIYADTAEVGHYQAGYTLFNRYAGLVFTAISMEFYPRLTSVGHSARRASLFVSHELSLVLWLLIPIAALFITLAKPIVTLLYSHEFEVIVPYVSWGIVGTVLRAASWCMAFTIISRGDGKLFLITETASAVVCLALNVICYRLGGLTGLGVSYILWYAAYTLIIAWVYYHRYQMRISRGVLALTAVALVVTTASAITSLYIGGCIPAAISAICVIVSYRRLRHLIAPKRA